MHPRRNLRARVVAASLVAALSLLASCLPTAGTRVWVDRGAGDFWSGRGILIEVSPDETQCRVVVRDGTLIKRTRWVACANVHPRR